MKPIKMLALVTLAMVICLANLGAVEIVTEDFESGALPSNWTQEYVTSTYDWAVGTGSPTGFPAAAYSGTNNAIMHNLNPGVTKLVMPAMDLSAYQGGMVTLEFYRAQLLKGEEADKLKVYTKDASDADWVLVKEFADATDSWKKETIRLKGVTDAYQVAFEVDFSNKNGVLLDDIKLTAETPVKDTVRVGNTEGADYATLGELFTDINNRDLEGTVTVFITSDIEETGPISLNEFDNGSLVIKAFGGAHTISGVADNGALITLLGADNVIFQGSLVTDNTNYNPEDDSEDAEPQYLESFEGHNLTFDNTSTANGSVFLLTDVEGNGSQSIVFSNLNIDGATDGTSSSVSNGIAVWGNDLSAADGSSGHSNLVFTTSTFSSASTGLKIASGAADEIITGINITSNTFADEDDTFVDAAISTKYSDNVLIAGNTISNFGNYAISVVENNNVTNTSAAMANISGNTFSDGSEVEYVINVESSPQTMITGNTFNDLTADRAVYADEVEAAQVMGNTIVGGKFDEVVYISDAADVKVNSNNIMNLTAGKGLYISNADNAEVSGNNITNLTAERGLYINNADNAVVSSNKVQHISIDKTEIRGIYLAASENATFSRNIVSDVKLVSSENNTSTNRAMGFDFGSGVDGTTLVSNAINNIGIEMGDVQTNDRVYGVRFYYGTDNVTLSHNTIALEGTFDDANSSSAGNHSAPIAVDGNCDNWDVQNNIFSNKYFGLGGDSKAYILYAASYTVSADALNHNAYDIEDASVAGAAIARLASNNIYTLADWQTLTGLEADGTANKVYFVDGLHLDKNSINDLTLRAPKIDGIDTDLDNEERPDGENTYIGADVVNVTVELGDDLYINGGETTYCEGQNVTMTYSLSGTFADGIERTITNGITVNWEHNGDLIDPNETEDSYLISANGMRLVVEPVMHENEGIYRAIFQYQGAEAIATQEVEIEVKQPVHISQNLQNVITGCAENDVLTFGVQAEHALEYIWQKLDEESGEYVDITLDEDETFTENYTIDLNVVEHTDAEGKYRVRVIGNELCASHHDVELTSDPIEVVVYDKIKGVTTTPDFEMENICQGQTLKFNASIESGDLIGYKWQKNVVGNWVDIDASENPTAVTETLVIENISFDDNGRYRAVAIGYNECQTLTSSDNDIDISVPDAFAINQNPEAQVVCKDETASFMVSGNNVGEVLSYQWLKDGMPMSVEDNEFADDAILYVNDADYKHIGEYSCLITAEDCNGVNEFTSEPAILYVLRETEITRQPTSVTAAAGDDVTFVVEAHMKGIVPPYYQHDFQWYKKGVALQDNDRIQGAKSSMLTINDVEAADFENYYCVVTGQCGVATSRTAAITENFTVEIATQPQATAACQGAQAQFSVDADPSDTHMTVSYEWYFNGNKLSDDADYQGTTTETLTVAAAALALEGKYSVKCISDYAGQHIEVMSDEAELDVQTAPEVALVTDALVDFEEESTLTLEIDVISESSTTFQWQKDGADIAGANSMIFEIAKAELTDAGTYTCTATNNCGDVTSDNIVVNIIKKTDTGVEENTVAGLRINEVTPNPVHSVATITVENRMASDVKVYLTDATGRKVATLFEGMLEGSKDIVIDANASNLTSGAYMITMEANGTTMTKSFVVAK